MDRVCDELGVFEQYGNSDFGLIDFMDNEANFDRYIDLIRGDTQQQQPHPIFTSNINYQYQNNINMGVPSHDHDHIVEAQFYPAPETAPMGLFDFVDNPNLNTPDFGLLPENGMLCQADVQKLLLEEEDEEEEEWSGSGSGTTPNNETSKKSDGKNDRSRTLISERKRRSRMKEKLYALRSLVPNITKMDKASIVGDAVSYVQDMKMQAKKLRAEIASLESSLNNNNNNNNNGGDKYQEIRSSKAYPTSINLKIFKMDISQVEEKGFYVRIVANRGKSVAMLLYRGLESLKTFTIHSSNLAATADNYVFTFTLHTIEGENMGMINLENVKLWMVSVFLNQGFEFQTICVT